MSETETYEQILRSFMASYGTALKVHYATFLRAKTNKVTELLVQEIRGGTKNLLPDIFESIFQCKNLFFNFSLKVHYATFL